MNKLCLRPNENERARWVTCNWIQSPKKERSQKKKAKKKERKERKLGLDSNVGRRECETCEWCNWALSNRKKNTNFEMLTRFILFLSLRQWNDTKLKIQMRHSYSPQVDVNKKSWLRHWAQSFKTFGAHVYLIKFIIRDT